MAGLAAYFGTRTDAVSAMCEGLAARGDDVARWSAETHNARLEVAIRAGIPQVHTGSAGLAIAVDGVAEPSTILGRYIDRGAAAVLGVRTPGTEPDPYALVLADPDRGVLVLARCGDGPSLYYARHGADVLIASEPSALIAAGLPAAPDETVVRRFLADGSCDRDSRTFYAGVRRVLPDHVLEVAARGVRLVTGNRGSVQMTSEPGSTPATTALALQQIARTGRLAVRLGDDVAGVALLGVALASADPFSGESGPLPVYSNSGGAHAYLDPVLAAMPGDLVSHKALLPRLIDIDELLAALGEPVPDPNALYIWCAAREAAGEVDALLDPVGAEALLSGALAPGYLPRVADRVATRFGIALRMPYLGVPGGGGALRFELAAMCRRGLPPEAARLADRRVPSEGTLELLRSLRSEVYATFLARSFGSRGWQDARLVVEGFGELLAGRRFDADRFWRLFLVERWLRRLEGLEASPCPVIEVSGEPTPLPPPVHDPGGESHVTLDGMRWLRLPVRTRALRNGDLFADTLAAYIAEMVTAAAADDRYRRRLRRPWYLAVGARPLAVTQGRVRPLWEVEPGWWARRLSTFVRDRSWQGLGNPWTMQLAIEEIGLHRMLLAAAAGGGARLLGRRGVFDRVAGDPVRALSGPVERSGQPVNVAVAAAPRDAEQAVVDILALTRSRLRDELASGLAGCALITPDRSRGACRVLASVGDRPADFYVAACAGDPLGASDSDPAAAVIALSPPATPAGRRTTPRRGTRR